MSYSTHKSLPYLLSFICLFKTFLIGRQIFCLNSCKTHPTIPPKELEQTKNYNKERHYLSLFRMFVSLALDIFIIKKDIFHKFFSYFSNTILGMTFFYVSYSIISTIIFIPFDLVSNFIIEERYGFNKMTLSLFFSDLLKSTMIFSVINFVFIYALIYCISNFAYFYIYAFIFFVVLQIFIIVLYPIVILPLFNKFTELEEGSLKTEIKKLIRKINSYLSDPSSYSLEMKKNEDVKIANDNEEMDKEKEEESNITNESYEEQNIHETKEEKENKDNEEKEDYPFVKVKKILKMDGSKRSHHSNAYFIGLFKEKRIVLFDTLMDKMSTSEIIAVLGHEFGHASRNHIYKNLSLMFLIQLLVLFTYSFTCNKNEVIIIDFIYFSYYLSFVNIFLSYLQSYVSRKFEVEADEFAINLGLGLELRSGLIKLYQDNKAPPVTDKWYSIYVNSHPTLEERVDFIDKKLKKNE